MEEIGFSITEGGILYGIEIPPNKNRIFLAVWPSRAVVQILHHSEPPLVARPGDCIQLLVTSSNNVTLGWYLSEEDTKALIYGLHMALVEHEIIHAQPS